MNNVDNANGGTADVAEQLRLLEYAIRRSITVREDQEDPADPELVEAARALGVKVEEEAGKGDLLGAVQTRLRAASAKPAS
jgi:hypothetical protein